MEDPRVERTRRRKPQGIVVISVMAVIGFADGWTDIVPFAKDQEELLRTVLELPGGIPSDDTFRRVTSAPHPVAFQSCLRNWVRGLMAATEGKLVAIDGKTVRRSFAREDGKSALHEVSAWAQLALKPKCSAKTMMEALGGIEATLVRPRTGKKGRPPTALVRSVLDRLQRCAVELFELTRWMPQFSSSRPPGALSRQPEPSS